MGQIRINLETEFPILGQLLSQLLGHLDASESPTYDDNALHFRPHPCREA